MEQLEEILTKIRAELVEAGKEHAKEELPQVEQAYEAPVKEFSVKHLDKWHKLLFGLVCQRWGLLAYRKPIDGPTMSHVKTTKFIFEEQVWPEFMNHGAVLERQVNLLIDNMIEDIYPNFNELTIKM